MKGLPGGAAHVLLFRIMQVLIPSGGHAGVGMHHAFDHVFTGQDHVTDQATAFTRAANVGQPAEVVVRILGGLALLQCGDRTINGAEVVIAGCAPSR